MKHKFFYLLTLLILCSVIPIQAQDFGPEKQAIMEVLSSQEQAWNRGDLEVFMRGYWKSDSLRFIGSRGVTYGWQATLENYKKSYPNQEIMGKLKFEILQIEFLASDVAFVIGKWALKRKGKDAGGHFSLIWKKLDGEWKIVADHSS